VEAEIIDSWIGIISSLQEDNSPAQSSQAQHHFVRTGSAQQSSAIVQRLQHRRKIQKMARQQQQQQQYRQNSLVHCRYHYSVITIIALACIPCHCKIAIVCLDCCVALLVLLVFASISRYNVVGTQRNVLHLTCFPPPQFHFMVLGGDTHFHYQNHRSEPRVW